MSIKFGDAVRDGDGAMGTALHFSTQGGRRWVLVEYPNGRTHDWLLSSVSAVGAPRDPDPVQSPPHYDLPGGIQVIDLIRGESFLRGNIIKYVLRAPHKGKELEDMRKAAEYVKWEIERLENEQSS